MTFIVGRDTYLEIGREQAGVDTGLAGFGTVHKFGRNDSVGSGAWSVVNLLGTATASWPLISTPTTVRIKAGGDANDTAAGSGARQITVQGIKADGTEDSETITTAGASASSATTATFWRVHRAWVSQAGTYGGANAADITIENGAGGTDLMKIAADEGQTQFGAYTVPDGKRAYFISLHATVDSGKRADLRLFTLADIADATPPVESRRLRLYFDGLESPFVYKPKSPEFSIEGPADIWVEARGSGAASEVAVDFELILEDV